MALLNKFDDGGTTEGVMPQTVLIYGEDYDVNMLDRAIYTGLPKYLSRLDTKNKNKQYVVEAVNDLWNGMKEELADGKRVVYNGAYFTDYKGILKNADKDKKDYVGMAAYYLGHVFDNAKNPVKKPTSYKYAPWLVGSVVLRNAFNNSDGKVPASAIKDWLALDLNINGQMTTTGRALYLRDILQNIHNDPHAFDEYNWSQEDKDKAYMAVQNVIDSLNVGLDEGIQPEDFAALLSNLGVLGDDLGWSTLFSGDNRSPEQIAEEQEAEKRRQEEEANWENQWIDIDGMRFRRNSYEDVFEEWLNKKYPRTSAENQTIDMNFDIDNENIRSANLWLNTVPVDRLYNIINKIINNQPSDNFHVFKRRFGIDDIEFFKKLLLYNLSQRNIPWTKNGDYLIMDKIIFNDDEDALLMYNPATSEAKIGSRHNNQSWRDTRKSEFDDILYNNRIMLKQGGVLSFNKGGVVGKYETPANPLELPKGGYEDIYEAGKANDYAAWADINNAIRYRRKYNNGNWEREERGNRNATNNDYPGSPEYDPEDKNKNPELWSENQYWIDILEGNQNVAEKFARDYKSLMSNDANKLLQINNWFDKDNKFNFDAFKNSRKLWTDAINGIGHDFYRGKLYAIKDNGKTTYYTGPIKGWENDGDLDTSHGLYDVQYLKRSATPEGTPTPDTTPAASTTPEDGKKPDTKRDETDASKVHFNYNHINLNNQPKTKSYGMGLTDWPVYTLGVARMLTHLRGNTKARDLLLGAQHPALKNTYERYSPVTGDFATMQNYNNQAAQAMRLLWNNLTTDAVTNLSAMLDANSLANQYRAAGFAKDNERIRETAKEALERQEDNMKRRSDVANENRTAINENNKTRAQIKADWQKKKTETITNWLAENQKYIQTKLEDRASRVRNAYEIASGIDFQNQLDQLESEWMANHTDEDGKTPSITEMYNASDYQQAYRRLYSQLQLSLAQNSLRDRIKFNYTPTTYDTEYNKRGGVMGRKLVKRRRR